MALESSRTWVLLFPWLFPVFPPASMAAGARLATMQNTAFCAKELAAMHFAAPLSVVQCWVQTNRKEREEWETNIEISALCSHLQSPVLLSFHGIGLQVASYFYFILIAFNINYFPSGSLYQLPIHCDLEISEISQFEYLNCFFSSWQIKER